MNSDNEYDEPVYDEPIYDEPVNDKTVNDETVNDENDDVQEINEPPNIFAVRKTPRKSADESSSKKVKVNINKSANSISKKSYVWDYFKNENDRDYCKILVFRVGVEVECGTNYKHD
ncbi:18909_t:CDS:1, partial [Racocetra fulgida]